MNENELCLDRIKDNDENNYVFIRIHKNATNSISKALGLGRSSHFSAEFYIDNLGIEKWKSKFTFAFFRNPWDRALSYFAYMQRWEKENNSDKYWLKLDFNEWVLDGCPFDHNSDFVGAYPQNPICQSNWVSYNGNICVDFIGSVENIEDDFERLCLESGNVKVEDLRVLNSTSHKKYVEYYSDSAIEKISDLCSKDIELNSYRFG